MASKKKKRSKKKSSKKSKKKASKAIKAFGRVFSTGKKTGKNSTPTKVIVGRAKALKRNPRAAGIYREVLGCK